MRVTESESQDMLTVRLFMRYERLRKQDAIRPVLQRPVVGRCLLWVFSNPVDPWGSRERISFEQFERMIEAAEASVRIGPGREMGARSELAAEAG